MLPVFGDIDMVSQASAPSRIYVGNLMEGVVPEELYELMKKYGNIIGMKIKQRYAFIQYEHIAGAEEALKDSSNISLNGSSLLIQTALRTTRYISGVPVNSEGNMGDDGSYEEDTMNSPRNNMHPYPMRGRGRGGRGQMPPMRNNFRDRSPMNRGPGDWGDRGGYDKFIPNEGYHPPTLSDRNDCEIIVVSKILTEYAEIIENRLKRIGLVVDLLFPNEDVPIGRVLGNILSRGCLYAILVTPQNEMRWSITLYILHGLPQEHRNMPLECALTLVMRNFDNYQRNGGTNDTELTLLRQLSTGGTLTVLQYDLIMNYIKECRDKQVKVELGNVNPNQLAMKTQTDLQQRIMSILNTEGKTNAPEPKPQEPPKAQSDELRQRIASLLGASSSANPASSTSTVSNPAPASNPANKQSILSIPNVQKMLNSLINKRN